MVKTLISFTILFSFSAGAEIQTHPTPDSQWGHFEVSMEQISDRAYDPFVMRVSAVCKDQRSGTHALKPPTSQPLAVDAQNNFDENLCDFLGHKMEDGNTKITISYVKQKRTEKLSKNPRRVDCSQKAQLSFDLKEICKVWGPTKD